MAVYRMTAARKAALRKAQMASARKRRGRGKGKLARANRSATRNKRIAVVAATGGLALAAAGVAGAYYAKKTASGGPRRKSSEKVYFDANLGAYYTPKRKSRPISLNRAIKLSANKRKYKKYSGLPMTKKQKNALLTARSLDKANKRNTKEFRTSMDVLTRRHMPRKKPQIKKMPFYGKAKGPVPIPPGQPGAVMRRRKVIDPAARAKFIAEYQTYNNYKTNYGNKARYR